MKLQPVSFIVQSDPEGEFKTYTLRFSVIQMRVPADKDFDEIRNHFKKVVIQCLDEVRLLTEKEYMALCLYAYNKVRENRS